MKRESVNQLVNRMRSHPKRKMDWTMEDFKTSADIIDRTVWFIATLSPHNLWKGEEAIRKLLAEKGANQ